MSVGDSAEAMLEWFEGLAWWKKLVFAIPVVVLTILAAALLTGWNLTGANAVSAKVKRSKRKRDERLTMLERKEKEIEKKVEESKARQEGHVKALERNNSELKRTLGRINDATTHIEVYESVAHLKQGGGDDIH